MTNQISIKNYSTVANSDEYTPRIFDLNIKEEENALHELLKSNPNKIVLIDEIECQLKELFKVRNPLKRKISEFEYSEGINSIMNGSSLEHYGLWVYYPWNFKLVHIVKKEEFIELRTSRNKYKITQQEQNQLSTQKIGVIGLSVGQSIALTMAMERTFGEIRLADFDSIELTNLNRIRTGIQSLGVPKVIVAAREIAEIDPFLKVICYQEGITEENIDDFFLSGGKLDIVIEECDGLDVKILTRIKARQLGVPVVMDTSDRGMIDIERFDLEPNRALLHGLIEEIDPKKLKNLTNEEKIPYLLPMVGVDTMSSRLRASAIEVGQSLTTWPQLATSVILGGALAGDVCRRISLGQLENSGRYFIDLDELIPNSETKTQSQPVPIPLVSPLTNEEISQLLAPLELIPEEGQMELSNDDLKEILKLSTLAPSGGNSQPWRWHYKNKFLSLFFDKSSSTSFLDFDDTASLISLGTSIENLVLAAHSLGFEVVQRPASLTDSHKLISTFSFFQQGKKPKSIIEPHDEDTLVHQIDKRFTNRKNPNFEPIEPSVLQEFSELSSKIPGARVQCVTNQKQMEEIGEIIAACDRIRLLHTQSHFDFISKEMRWDENELLQKMDGIAVNSLELTPLQLASIRIIKDPQAIQFLKEWKLGYSFKEISMKNIKSASAVGFITIKGYNASNFVLGGRLAQKIWLSCTEKGIALHPLCVPLSFFSRLIHGNPSDFGDYLSNELKSLRTKFTSIFETGNDEAEIFMFRVFRAADPELKTIRQPLKNILSIG